MDSLKTLRFPLPENEDPEYFTELSDYVNNHLEDEMNREKELRDLITGIKGDMRDMDKEVPKDRGSSEAYNQLAFYRKKEDSFLFRNTIGGLLPDSLSDIAAYSELSEESVREAYRKAFEEEDFDRDETIDYLDLKIELDRSDLIDLRSDPAEDLKEASEELERVKYHLLDVAERSTEKYDEVVDETERELEMYIDRDEKVSEDDIIWKPIDEESFSDQF